MYYLKMVYNFRDPVLLLITPNVANLTSFKKLEELCITLPPNIILTCGLDVFKLYIANDSSYVTPPITNTIISWTLIKIYINNKLHYKITDSTDFKIYLFIFT